MTGNVFSGALDPTQSWTVSIASVTVVLDLSVKFKLMVSCWLGKEVEVMYLNLKSNMPKVTGSKTTKCLVGESHVDDMRVLQISGIQPVKMPLASPALFSVSVMLSPFRLPYFFTYPLLFSLFLCLHTVCWNSFKHIISPWSESSSFLSIPIK